MSFLRRRFGGRTQDSPPSSEPSRDPSPSSQQDTDPAQQKRLVSVRTLQQLKASKQSKRRNLWIFGLGGLFGIAVAAFFAGSNDMLDLSALDNLNMAAILEVLPEGLIRDAQQLQVGRNLVPYVLGIAQLMSCGASRNMRKTP